ncbi:MAG TPA: DUF488 domain-containing protein [Pseudoxanthomonas sp.]|nr:DUF488 domain-containing protein [Pseudoxanthomonas sp.]
MEHPPTTIFTIGHSSRSLDEFMGLLSESQIECIVDVRRLPGSRRYPQYDVEALADTLKASGIEYWHLLALCGRRTKAELDGAPPEDFWTNASFARYAAYARGAAFRQGLDDLMDRAAAPVRCALMCSEAVWWRCHRRIIADHLLARGIVVHHILGAGQIQAAPLTAGARLSGSEVVYPSQS